MPARRLLRWAALAVLTGALLALPVAVGGVEPAWEQLDDVPVPERQEVSYVALGGKTYLAGGNHTDHQRFDPATGTWTNMARLPDAFASVDHIHGVAVGGKIVYIGGIVSWDPPRVSSTVAVYTPPSSGDADGSFTLGAPMTRPRGAGGVAVHDGKVIYAGGLTPYEDRGAVAWVDEYDPVQDQWQQRTDMPRPRDHFQAAIVDGRLFAVGGRDTRISSNDTFDVQSPYVEVDALDLTSGQWTADVTRIPTPRGGHGVAAIGNCIYAAGGEGTPTESDGVTGITEVYNVTADEWMSLASLTTPRHGVQAAVVGQTIYIAAGGSVEEDYQPVTGHESLTVADVPGCESDDPGDPGGGGAPPDGGPVAQRPPADPVRPAAPRLTALSLSPRRFKAVGRPHGTRIKYSLTGAAKVRLRFERGTVGRRRAGSCRKATRRLRAKPRCTRWVAVGQLRRNGRRGENSIAFSGRLGGRILKPGRYRVAATVVGDGSLRLIRRSFRVVR
jgi:hypothetical protein